MSDPRASTDEESAPLLDRHASTGGQSFFQSLLHPPRKLTTLEKLLAGAAVLFLILMSTFVGLFAGAEHTLKNERGKAGTTITATHTQYATTTSTATTTVVAVPTGKPAKEVCLTADCVLLSADILKNMNSSVDPCDDFYEFANGGWVSTNKLAADKSKRTAFNEVSESNQKIILSLLEWIPDKVSPKPTAEEENLHKLKSVYTSCINLNHLNEVGLEPFIPLVEHVLSSFGKFDLNPSPDLVAADAEDAWTGAFSEDYQVPADLSERVSYIEEIKAMRTARPTSEKLEPLSDDLMTVATKTDEERKARLTNTLTWLHSRGVDALFGFAIEGDAGGEDSQVQSLWFYQTSGGLPSKEYYEEKPILDLYQTVVKDILIDVASNTHAAIVERDLVDDIIAEVEEVETQGWPWPWPGDDPKPGPGEDKPNKTKEEPLEYRMDKLATKVAHFERELIRAGAEPENLFNPFYAYNPYPLDIVDKHLPFISLTSYLSAFSIRSFPSNITVTYPPYLKSVSKLVESTPDYVLSAYFITRLSFAYSTALGPKTGVRSATRRLQEVLSGLKKGTEENRQDVCLSWVDNLAGYIAGAGFVKEAFSPEAKEDGENVIKSIVKAFSDKLPHIAWMDKESAKAAQLKANSLIAKVGYPLTPDTTDPQSIARWYARTELKADDFFGNVLRSEIVDSQRTWATLGRVRDRQSWEMYPQTVNAYYSPPDGEIVFPAGILQPPFYSQNWPAHLKYGAFGAVAAHELTHAFDNSGAQYDEHGRLRDWWTNSTVKAFNERANCIASQYSKYYVYDAEGKKVYVNGNLTNGENIGDSGLVQAFAAYKDVASSFKSELSLPGLEYTSDQLFFIAFARVWRILVRPAAAVSGVRTDPHSPNYWRVMGTLTNVEAFHQAFQCKEGSRMNPKKEDQCRLW